MTKGETLGNQDKKQIERAWFWPLTTALAILAIKLGDFLDWKDSVARETEDSLDGQRFFDSGAGGLSRKREKL